MERMIDFKIPDRIIDVYVLFLQTADAVTKYTEIELLKAGISYTQYSVLILLDNTPVPLTLTELSKWMFRSKNSMTTVIDHLERDGLVRRVRDTRDRRSIKIIATEAGKELLDRVRQPSRDLVYRIMSCYDEDNLDHFADFLQILRKNVLEKLARDSGRDEERNPSTELRDSRSESG